ncbi:TmcC family electron transfer complex membrane anchor subunit [Pseudodesulfovibrio sp. zrk46]|uniref:TmcC family electron transfer complex membrane anchor subunit n=1 Tax=Pseudodesulfovibrio sp. zrk46 TaxID=2725288 RepID=UPI001449C59E|nr:respiratory nitrate reductase subunit gamma [Pseudodesulfovibrio sp. zrk46]QJB54980.1 respiratory nitrate reductase subunit gamma [Pseudodesulfovibrio sp. zrk46]
MIELYNLVSGPLAWVAWGIFIIGSIYRLVTMYSLAKAKDGSSLAYMSLPFGLRSIFNWMIPFNTQGWKSDPLMTVATFAFHIGFLLVAVFLGAHVVLWDTAFGIEIPSLPTQVGDIISFIVIAGCLVFAYRRLALPHVKGVTKTKDWFALILVAAPFITGVLAYHQVGPVLLMTILHILAGEILLALIPFTRLSHALFVLFTRAYMGSEFGGVRNARDW